MDAASLFTSFAFALAVATACKKIISFPLPCLASTTIYPGCVPRDVYVGEQTGLHVEYCRVYILFFSTGDIAH